MPQLPYLQGSLKLEKGSTGDYAKKFKFAVSPGCRAAMSSGQSCCASLFGIADLDDGQNRMDVTVVARVCYQLILLRNIEPQSMFLFWTPLLCILVWHLQTLQRDTLHGYDCRGTRLLSADSAEQQWAERHASCLEKLATCIRLWQLQT